MPKGGFLLMPGQRLLVLSVFFCGYFLGFFEGRSRGRIAGAREALLGIIGGYTQGMIDRG